MIVDTWLDEDDVQRLWAVAHGELPEEFASGDELDEFLRVVEAVAMAKHGYQGQLRH